MLDASAVLPWCFTDEASEAGLALLRRLEAGEPAIVPAHWPAEVLSALQQGKRRGRIQDDAVFTFLDQLTAFVIEVDAPADVSSLASLKQVCDRLQLNAYDAVYFQLAKTAGLPLATLDDALIRACRAEGVEVI